MDELRNVLRLRVPDERLRVTGNVSEYVPFNHATQGAVNLRQREVSVHRFTSTAFPDSMSFPLLFGRAVIEPLAWCLIPLMVLCVVNALQGYRILPLIVAGAPVALMIASLWTVHHLKSEIALLWVADSVAAVVSIWECFHPDADILWQPVLDLRLAHDACYATIGDATVELEQAAWKDFGSIVDALRTARHNSA